MIVGLIGRETMTLYISVRPERIIYYEIKRPYIENCMTMR